ncbi:MAG: hypothetical protein C4574_03935 [Candidatus Latescibacterota bacterium]|nr:MAG: hypothetical protein C4574_03935 [Candidatus Latescibacterota bacterium]
MNVRGTLATIAVLAAAAGAHAEGPRDGSRFALRLDVAGSMHPSDANLETAYYPAGPDYSIFTDRETKMLYHFDQKFGASISGALCYRLTETFDCECGLGFTSYSINEIDQNSRRTHLEAGDRFNETIDYPEAENADFMSVVIRPAVRFKPASQGKIAMYLSAGGDVMILSGSGGLAFELPGTSIGGLPPDVAELEFDGSEVLLGFDFASGIEIALSPAVALHFGASYVVMQKAFGDFHEIVVDAELGDDLELIGYSFKGMSFSGLRAAAGVIWYP